MNNFYCSSFYCRTYSSLITVPVILKNSNYYVYIYTSNKNIHFEMILDVGIGENLIGYRDDW